MAVIEFTKEDFIEENGGFWFKAPHENASDCTISVVRIEENGTQKEVITEINTVDDTIAIGINRKDQAFNGKILIN